MPRLRALSPLNMREIEEKPPAHTPVSTFIKISMCPDSSAEFRSSATHYFAFKIRNASAARNSDIWKKLLATIASKYTAHAKARVMIHPQGCCEKALQDKDFAVGGEFELEGVHTDPVFHVHVLPSKVCEDDQRGQNAAVVKIPDIMVTPVTPVLSSTSSFPPAAGPQTVRLAAKLPAMRRLLAPEVNAKIDDEWPDAPKRQELDRR